MHARLLLLIGSTLIVTTTFAKPIPCDLGKDAQEEDVICYGPGKLFAPTINGAVGIVGPLHVHGVTMSNLHVGGLLELVESDVKKDANIAGEIKAKRGTFEGNLVIGSSDAELNHSLVKGSVTVETEVKKKEDKENKGAKQTKENKKEDKDKKENKPKKELKVKEVKDEKETKEEKIAREKKEKEADKTPILRVVCASEISGDIIFKGKPGIIQKSEDSVISGKVINATIEFIENPKCN